MSLNDESTGIALPHKDSRGQLRTQCRLGAGLGPAGRTATPKSRGSNRLIPGVLSPLHSAPPSLNLALHGWPPSVPAPKGTSLSRGGGPHPIPRTRPGPAAPKASVFTCGTDGPAFLPPPPPGGAVYWGGRRGVGQRQAATGGSENPVGGARRAGAGPTPPAALKGRLHQPQASPPSSTGVRGRV